MDSRLIIKIIILVAVICIAGVLLIVSSIWNSHITLIGILPVIIASILLLILTGVTAGINQKLQQVVPSLSVNVGYDYIGVGIALIILTMFIVRQTCYTAYPIERFTVSPITDLLSGITAAEKDVCNLITRTDKFIESDIGKPGQDDPSLVTAAQNSARAKISSGITVCPSTTWPTDVSDSDLLSEADNRLTKLEDTLQSFTGPEITTTYNKTVPCQESFEDQLSSLQARLTVVNQTIATQQTKYLKPIDDKNAALQRGEVSDCDKKRGANVGMAATKK